jgi:hypothetical protein
MIPDETDLVLVAHRKACGSIPNFFRCHIPAFPEDKSSLRAVFFETTVILN